MKRSLALFALGLLAACQHLPAEQPLTPAAPVREPVVPSEALSPGDVEVATPSLADAPPCLPLNPNPKISPRPSRPVARTPPPAAPEPVPQPPAAPAPEASVKAVENLSASVLGRKVQSLEGDDMGRVVDVLADAGGRVRIAIIEFGGFLGVGLKRVAVDWTLLKFRPGTPDTPLLLDVSRAKLQAAPEYKDSAHPLALMATPIAATVPAAAAPGASPLANPKN